MDVAHWCYMWDGLCWVECPGCKLVRTSRCSYKTMFDHDLTMRLGENVKMAALQVQNK